LALTQLGNGYRSRVIASIDLYNRVREFITGIND
jgi:hypothetical protein